MPLKRGSFERKLMVPFVKRLRQLKKEFKRLETPLARKLAAQEIKLMVRRLKQWKENPSGEVPKEKKLKSVSKP